MNTPANRPKIAGLALLGTGVAFYLLFTIAETAGGDIAGLQHLPPAAFLTALMVVAWKHPRRAGIILLVLAVTLAIAYFLLVLADALPLTPAALSVIAPSLLTGLLLAQAGGDRATRGRRRRVSLRGHPQ